MKLVMVPSSELGLDKRGSESAPARILDEVKNFYLNEKGEEKTFTLDSVKIQGKDVEKTNRNIYLKAKEINESAIFLGGDHSITFPLVKAYSEKNKNMGFLMLDAHADAVNHFNPPTHEDFLATLVEEGILNKENIVLVGLRNLHNNENNFLKRNNIKNFKMKDLRDVESICDSVMEICRDFDFLYLSIDIDVVDPSHAPGTGYMEPGGLSSRELIYLVQRLRLLNNLGAVDVVEVDPSKDINGMTVRLAAKIVRELL